MSSSNAHHENLDLSLRAVVSSRAIFFAASAVVYTVAIVSATLTLNPYFAQTWDVNTFIQAGHRFLDGGNPFDLYAQSRAAQTWPYAYPPLHAFVVALALFIGNLARVLPAYVWARVPVIVADIGVALVLYRIVLRQSSDETIARAAALLWLFNPITFYDTAAQGHFESEWLVFILLAYAWCEDARHIAWPTIALALAVLFKQTAILFAIPLWLYIFAGAHSRVPLRQRASRLLLSLLLFSVVIGAVCLPFLLYSNDFVFMNLTYVENVPVQTSSWIVALLGFTRAAPDALTSDSFLFRDQTIVTMLVAVAIAFIAARREWSLYLTGTLIALAFFLTSKKVMGYYYVMLFPFLLAEILPKRRFGLALIALVATTYISLAPYYAAWTNHAHWWAYAMLGMANSLFFVWLFCQMIADRGLQTDNDAPGGSRQSAIMVSLGLFATAIFAAWLQPLLSNNGSPIRAPIIAAGMETSAALAFIALIVLSALTLALIARATRNIGAALPRAAFGVVLIFAPLFFSVYTLTKESTTIFEIALKLSGA